jgi:hypothetical protein
MPLETQIVVASVINRSYETTVPWNTPAVPFPIKDQNNFPKLNNISADFVCKRTQNVVIEGEKGTFYGPVKKVTGLPQGYSAFVTDEWLHCSSVLNGTFCEGRRVSMKLLTKQMKLVNTKFQSDGSKLQKIEIFGIFGIESGFYKNDVKVEGIIERFNLESEEQDWFSLKPKGGRYYCKHSNKDYFGELDPHNLPRGRGIMIHPPGFITIGYWSYGEYAPGNFTCIFSE